MGDHPVKPFGSRVYGIVAMIVLAALAASAQDYREVLINFSQFPAGYYITNQYQSYGILFNGSKLLNAPPFISDNYDGFATALIGEPIVQNYNQTIVGTFVDPATGNPRTVSHFEFKAGIFADSGSVELTWYDASGNLLGSKLNTSGTQTFAARANGIASWMISNVGYEANNWEITNLMFPGIKLTASPNATCVKQPTNSCPGPPPQATCDPTNPCSPNIVYADGLETSTLYVQVTPPQSLGVNLSLAAPAIGSVTSSVQTDDNGTATATYTAGTLALGQDIVQGAIGSQPFLPLSNVYDFSGFVFNTSQVDNNGFINSTDLSASNIQTFFDNVISGGDFLAKFYFDDDTVGAGWYNPNGTGKNSDIYAKTDQKYCPISSNCPVVGDTGTSAAGRIARVAGDYGINPKLLLVKLEVEQSLISKSAMPKTPTLNYATGCPKKSNPDFLSQLDCAANTFITSFNLDPTPNDPYFWPVSSRVANSIQLAYSVTATSGCVDNRLITGCVLVGFYANDAATFAQYRYTPFIDTFTNGLGGVGSFEYVWQEYEGSGWYQ
jgi:hypothetical protein